MVTHNPRYIHSHLRGFISEFIQNLERMYYFLKIGLSEAWLRILLIILNNAWKKFFNNPKTFPPSM